MTTYEVKYAKAAECLEKDRDTLLTFYDFPAEHWVHIRTTNPIGRLWFKIPVVEQAGASELARSETSFISNK